PSTTSPQQFLWVSLPSTTILVRIHHQQPSSTNNYSRFIINNYSRFIVNNFSWFVSTISLGWFAINNNSGSGSSSTTTLQQTTTLGLVQHQQFHFLLTISLCL